MSTPLSKNSRKITIYQKGTFLDGAQKESAPEFMAMAKKSIGSFWKTSESKVMGSGLSFEEQKLLMPELVDCEPDDRQFRQKVYDYFSSMRTVVPYGKGKTLEIGLSKSNKEPVSKDNMPIEISEYITYRHALAHPLVAASKQEADNNMLKEYYIFDAQAQEDAEIEENTTKDEALAVYLKISKESTKIDMLLTLLGTDPRKFKGKNATGLKKEALKEISEKRPKDLLDVYGDKLFEAKYEIQSMINTAILGSRGELIFDPETGETIGHNLSEAIAWIKAPANNQKYVLLKGRLQEALKGTTVLATEKVVGKADDKDDKKPE